MYMLTSLDFKDDEVLDWANDTVHWSVKVVRAIQKFVFGVCLGMS